MRQGSHPDAGVCTEPLHPSELRKLLDLRIGMLSESSSLVPQNAPLSLRVVPVDGIFLILVSRIAAFDYFAVGPNGVSQCTSSEVGTYGSSTTSSMTTMMGGEKRVKDGEGRERGGVQRG